MISPAQAEQIRELHRRGYNLRQIAKKLRISRETARTYVRKHYEGQTIRQFSFPSIDRSQDFVRCLGCGGMVVLPCVLCAIRKIRNVRN